MLELRSLRSGEQEAGNSQVPLIRSIARTGPGLTTSISGGSIGSLISESCAGGQ